MNKLCFCIKIIFAADYIYNSLATMSNMDTSMLTLSVVTAALVGYVVYEQVTSSTEESTTTPSETPVGRSRLGRARLGRSRAKRSRDSPSSCANAKIGTPDFARCATELGAGRNVLPGDPVNVAHNINTAFVNDEFTPQGAAAFPFSDSRSTRDGSREDGRRVGPELTGRSTQGDDDPLKFNKKSGSLDASSGEGGTQYLGAAVSPSAMGASREEILQSTKKAVKTTVSSNTGGNLNLLHPLE